MRKGRTAIFIIAGLDVVVLVVFVVLNIMKAMKTATVDINVVPSVAKVIINGQEYGNGTYKVYPGKVTAGISADGFVGKSVEVELKNDEITKIWDYLLHSEKGLSWYENNLDELDNLSKIGGGIELETFLRKMSIREILPYYYNAFDEATQKHVQFVVEVDTIDCPDRFCLQAVNTKNSTNELIHQVIKKEGYELDDYEVYYF